MYRGSGGSRVWHYACARNVDDPVGDLVRLPGLNRCRLTTGTIPIVAGFGLVIETPMIDRWFSRPIFDLLISTQKTGKPKQGINNMWTQYLTNMERYQALHNRASPTSESFWLRIVVAAEVSVRAQVEDAIWQG